jgi:hypothetical protein
MIPQAFWKTVELNRYARVFFGFFCKTVILIVPSFSQVFRKFWNTEDAPAVLELEVECLGAILLL